MKTKNFWSRRDFLFQAGGGISGLALAHLLESAGIARGRAVGGMQREGARQQPLCLEAAAFQASSQGGHLAVHDRRAERGRPLGLQAGADEVGRPAARRKDGRRSFTCGRVIRGRSCRARSNSSGTANPESWSRRCFRTSHSTSTTSRSSIRSSAGPTTTCRRTMKCSRDKSASGSHAAGSWVTYGLGCESTSLPAFVVVNDPRGGPIGGPTNWSAGYMPAAYQGTPFRALGDPIMDLKPVAGMTPETQRARLDLLSKLNELDMEKYPGATDLAARISSYELAFRMQGCAPQAIDINNESEATKKLYGMDETDHRAVWPSVPAGPAAGGARRAIRAGVPGRHGQSEHRYLGRAFEHQDQSQQHAKESDLPIAGLLTDLKANGLLDSTLVIWHGEFGRMPISQRGVGRDHNPGVQTAWMAGAGIKGGQSIGSATNGATRQANSRCRTTTCTRRCSICSDWITRSSRIDSTAATCG